MSGPTDVVSKRLETIIEPIAQGYDCVLWGVEYLAHSSAALLRIYIDKPDGITIEDCEKVSRQVSSVLDIEEVVSGQYTLEVSSPGLDCLLFKKHQYEQFIGKEVSVRLKVLLDGRRKYRGILKAVNAFGVVIVENDVEYLLPMDKVDKARVVI